MAFTHDPIKATLKIWANRETGNPDTIMIDFTIFYGQEGVIRATSKILPGIKMRENTPYGIFEPSGQIELTYECNGVSAQHFKRFVFDPINYLEDGYEYVITQLWIRFEAIIAWRQMVLNQ